MRLSFKQVFANARYGIGAFVIALSILSAILLWPNSGIIQQTLSSTELMMGKKLLFVLGLYKTLLTNYTIISATYLVLVAVLFGINISLLVFYLKKKQSFGKGHFHVTSVSGLVSGILGIGCAACGSVILTSVLGVTAAGSFFSFFPFHGAEFAAVGVLLLLLSIYYLLKEISKSNVC